MKAHFLSLFAAMVLAAAAQADTVDIEIRSISVPGYSASSIHDASRGAMVRDGVTYYGGGARRYSLLGTIRAERDVGAGTLTFLGGTLHGTALGSGTWFNGFNLGTDISIDVLGGGLSTTNGRPGGFLNTRMHQGTRTSDVDFYFHPGHFSGPANSWTGSLEGFSLWGNNTNDPEFGMPVLHSGRRIGVDLHGVVVTPEPTTLALLGSVLVGVAVRRRRKQRRS